MNIVKRYSLHCTAILTHWCFVAEVSIGFDQTSYTVSEPSGVVELVVNILGRVSEPFSISYGTLDGTAVGECRCDR